MNLTILHVYVLYVLPSVIYRAHVDCGRRTEKMSASFTGFANLSCSSHVHTSVIHEELMYNSPLHSPLVCPVFGLVSGLQAVLPEYLRARFVQAALSYIGCNEEGQFACRDNDCWCQCAVDYPHCNCPEVELRAMEASLLQSRDSWNVANQEFEESGQYFSFWTWYWSSLWQPTKQRHRWQGRNGQLHIKRLQTETSKPGEPSQPFNLNFSLNCFLVVQVVHQSCKYHYCKIFLINF